MVATDSSKQIHTYLHFSRVGIGTVLYGRLHTEPAVFERLNAEEKRLMLTHLDEVSFRTLPLLDVIRRGASEGVKRWM